MRARSRRGLTRPCSRSTLRRAESSSLEHKPPTVLRQCLALAVRQTASLAAFYVPEQAQGPRRMKVTLTLVNKGRPLYEGVHDITDASSFGNAFARAWLEVQDQKLMQTTSVGQLMEE